MDYYVVDLLNTMINYRIKENLTLSRMDIGISRIKKIISLNEIMNLLICILKKNYYYHTDNRNNDDYYSIYIKPSIFDHKSEYNKFSDINYFVNSIAKNYIII